MDHFEFLQKIKIGQEVLTPEQMMADVKLLRAALNEVRNQNLCDMGYCYGCHVGVCPKVQFTPEAILSKEALAATDRPEYKEAP